MRVVSTVHEIKTITKSISLSTGGFAQIELSEEGDGYLKIHLAKNPNVYHFNDSWRWIHYGKDKKNRKLLVELRDALNTLLESVEEP